MKPRHHRLFYETKNQFPKQKFFSIIGLFWLLTEDKDGRQSWSTRGVGGLSTAVTSYRGFHKTDSSHNFATTEIIFYKYFIRKDCQTRRDQKNVGLQFWMRSLFIQPTKVVFLVMIWLEFCRWFLKIKSIKFDKYKKTKSKSHFLGASSFQHPPKKLGDVFRLPPGQLAQRYTPHQKPKKAAKTKPAEKSIFISP